MPQGSATRPDGYKTPRRGPAGNRVARIAVLIRSHALPPFSYRVPEDLVAEIGVGTAVVVPLSGYGRLGIVVGFERNAEPNPSLKEIRATAPDLGLPARLVGLCVRISAAWAVPLQTVLRAALPPGISAVEYEVKRPAPGWTWERGQTVARAELRRALNAAALKAAEEEMRVVLAPARPPRRTIEWCVLEEGRAEFPPERAHRQRALIEALERRDGACPTARLLDEAEAGRASLRQLVRRGLIRLEERPEATPVFYTRGSGAELAPHEPRARHVVERGGAWVWRAPTRQHALLAGAIARAAAARGAATLVLAPETEAVERLVADLRRMLPAGLTVASYHAGLGRRRDLLYEAAGRGEVDVLVGTRSAALVPLGNLGAICVVDEPNESHRADPDGHEGIPVHARDLSTERARVEGVSVALVSPTPTLRLYAPESGASRLPTHGTDRWPTVRLVDLRGTGAVLSSVLLEACREMLGKGGRVGVLANRLGLATLVSCRRCGHVLSCQACERPLALHGGPQGGFLACANCGRREAAATKCPSCGSDRFGASGLAIGRVRALLADALGAEVGLFTADAKEVPDAPVVAGTARTILHEEWNLVAIPDADALLFGSGPVERGFRLLYGAAEATSVTLVAQTRSPEHPLLRAALAGDYDAFATAELPRRRALGYPPYGHLARFVLSGTEKEARHAVESWLRPTLEPGIEMIGPIPMPASGANPRTSWRLLLRGRRREPVASAAALFARKAAAGRGRLRARVEVDPEEV